MDFFDRCWRQYTHFSPQAASIHRLLTDRFGVFQNDHIAFRTFEDSSVSIGLLGPFFKKMGYVPRGEYTFEKKKLRAVHYEREEGTGPRLFVSELICSEFSASLQKTFLELSEMYKKNKVEESLGRGMWPFFNGPRPWKPSYKTYQALRQESEYAGWFYAMGLVPNHFTLAVHSLKRESQSRVGLEEINAYLKDQGHILNSSGGEIKGSPKRGLIQSSTMAEKRDFLFKEGEYCIPTCYYEFAERFPIEGEALYSGFLTDSADKIFESTGQ